MSDATAPLATLPQCSPQPVRCPSWIPRCAEACTTVCVHVRYLPPPSSVQLPSSLSQHVALVRSPNISVPSPIHLRQSPPASPVARRSVQNTLLPRLVACHYEVKISFAQVFPRVPQVCVDLAAQSPCAQGLVGHSHSVAECASTRWTTHVHVHFPLPQIMLFHL